MDLELFDDDQLLDDKHHDLIKKLVAFCGKQLKLPENTEMMRLSASIASIVKPTGSRMLSVLRLKRAKTICRCYLAWQRTSVIFSLIH